MTTPRFRAGDIVRDASGNEFEVAGYDGIGGSLWFSRMGSMRRHERLMTLAYRPPSRAEVEALRRVVLHLSDMVTRLTDGGLSCEEWRTLATEGLPE